MYWHLYLRSNYCTCEWSTCHHPHLLWCTGDDEAVRRSADHLLVSSPVHPEPPRIRRLHLLGEQHVLPSDGRDDSRRTAGQAEHSSAHQLLSVGSACAALSVADHLLAVPVLAFLQPAFRYQHDSNHGRGSGLLSGVLHRNTRKGRAPDFVFTVTQQ